MATGDGGGGGDQFHHSQDPASRLGKLMTIDIATGTPTILSRGLRNPWRFSFDRTAGTLVIGDVGQNLYEEIDVGLAANYGWPCREGFEAYGTDAGCAPPAVLASPVLTHTHSEGFCAIVGGYVVRDPGLPTLLGKYLYGDNCSAPLRAVDLANTATDTTLGLNVSSLSSYGEDGCGRILVVSLAGTVSRLIDGTLRACDDDGGGPDPTPTPTADARHPRRARRRARRRAPSPIAEPDARRPRRARRPAARRPRRARTSPTRRRPSPSPSPTPTAHADPDARADAHAVRDGRADADRHAARAPRPTGARARSASAWPARAVSGWRSHCSPTRRAARPCAPPASRRSRSPSGRATAQPSRSRRRTRTRRSRSASGRSTPRATSAR